MVKYLVEKIRPDRGYAHAFHLSFVAIIPFIMFVLIRVDLSLVALLVLFLSKWRMFAIHPRHWLSHIRANSIDIIAGVSFWVLMLRANNTGAIWLMLLWLALFEIWLLAIKPSSSIRLASLQALVGAIMGYSTIFLLKSDAPLSILVLSYWAVSYVSARHFLNAFEEKHARLLSSIWAFFGASLMWVLGHWLIFVGPIAHPALLLSSLAFGLAGLYYLEQNDRLSSAIRQQIIFTMFAVVFVLIIFSKWGEATI